MPPHLLVKSVRVTDYKNIDNKLILINKGKISWGQGVETLTAKEGDSML